MRKLFGKYFLRFAGANLASFVLFYISAYILMNDSFEYARYFIGEAFDFALPVISAMVVSSAISERGFSALWLAPFISLGRLVYFFPYFYLYFIDKNLLTSESLIVSLPAALAASVIDCLIVCLVSFIIYLITDTLARKRGRSFSDSVHAATSPFDLSEEYTLAILAVGGGVFLINFVIEIIDTVSYLVTYSGNYRPEEIIFIVVSFIMLIAELLLCQFITIKFNEKRIEHDDL